MIAPWYGPQGEGGEEPVEDADGVLHYFLASLGDVSISASQTLRGARGSVRDRRRRRYGIGGWFPASRLYVVLRAQQPAGDGIVAEYFRTTPIPTGDSSWGDDPVGPHELRGREAEVYFSAHSHKSRQRVDEIIRERTRSTIRYCGRLYVTPAEPLNIGDPVAVDELGRVRRPERDEPAVGRVVGWASPELALVEFVG